MKEILQGLVLPKISSPTNEEIIAYLHRYYKIAEITDAVKRDTLVLKLCEQLNITTTDEELQTDGDTFRQKNNLLTASETFNWLEQQQITPEEWSEGIRLSLLTRKLKEFLFGISLDTHYVTQRDDYKRVAISQILVRDLLEAKKIVQALKEEKATFCALALEHSKGKNSRENGGFVGIRFWSELAPEIAQALVNAKEGEIVGPVQTKLGYHILRVEKWIITELNEEVREQILELLFQSLLQVGSYAELSSATSLM
ncbi:MAG TPA: peptidylprolyl isomerase [Nostocaceae cyanobacterium]|nr:peptidylprolyl isomerase [Nostocaceae cyanobacterium]